MEARPEILRYVVEKGSIAVDGVSLTVARVGGTTFTVALIPHTLGATTLEDRRVGDVVNLEVDILAKYIERLLGRGAGGGVTEELLRRHGFA
jgi:riboflavin synthase